MSQEQKKTISTRVISTIFIVLALGIFKPFGLETWHWWGYAHLLGIFLLGLVSCTLTEGILHYLVNKPRSLERGVDYIISRNLWFQLINTPLVSLLICLYRHLVMSDLVPGNRLSWGNYLETLLIIAFCSFAIGLYWRFKFRSTYLAAELEDTRRLNERLQQLQHEARQAALAAPAPTQEPANPTNPVTTPPSTITLTGSTSDTITLHVPDLLYIEAVGNYLKVYQLTDRQVRSDMLRATSKQMEEVLRPYPMIVRCHRAFLVNLQQVERIAAHAGTMQLVIKYSNDQLPVSRSNMAQIKEAINGL